VADPFIGEIRLFAGSFAPQDWADCAGQNLSIAEYDALFTLIGTTYGGDGQSTFALPDLRSRVPLHMGQSPGGSSYILGQNGGTESVTLTKDQTGHTHFFQASTVQGKGPDPSTTVVVARSPASAYVQDLVSADFAPSSLLPAGNGAAHENRQPFQAVRFIISLIGIYPPQS
jgi:microcystin-dependent protein